MSRSADLSASRNRKNNIQIAGPGAGPTLSLSAQEVKLTALDQTWGRDVVERQVMCWLDCGCLVRRLQPADSSPDAAAHRATVARAVPSPPAASVPPPNGDPHRGANSPFPLAFRLK